MELANEQWERIKDLVPDPVKPAYGRGRPARDKRQVMEGVLRILRTGAPWKDLPLLEPALSDLPPQVPAVAGVGRDAEGGGGLGPELP